MGTSAIGEGTPFWILDPEFEEYFEELKALAEEPAPGMTGACTPEI
jgi:hypothetical protein